MKTKAVVAVLGLAAATLALPAAAQMSMNAAYIGGQLGQTNFKADCSGVDCDKKDTSFRIFGGYQFTPNIAAELGYADLGKLKVSGFGIEGDVAATAWDLSGVFSWPIQQFGVFGRLGVARVEAKPGGAFSGFDSNTKTGLVWGLGGSYDFNRNVGLRLEWTRYKADSGSLAGEGDIDNLSIGVLYRFK
jgi:OmpA-OmpF porin, OOP family